MIPGRWRLALAAAVLAPLAACAPATVVAQNDATADVQAYVRYVEKHGSGGLCQRWALEVQSCEEQVAAAGAPPASVDILEADYAPGQQARFLVGDQSTSGAVAAVLDPQGRHRIDDPVFWRAGAPTLAGTPTRLGIPTDQLILAGLTILIPLAILAVTIVLAYRFGVRRGRLAAQDQPEAPVAPVGPDDESAT